MRTVRFHDLHRGPLQLNKVVLPINVLEPHGGRRSFQNVPEARRPITTRWWVQAGRKKCWQRNGGPQLTFAKAGIIERSSLMLAWNSYVRRVRVHLADAQLGGATRFSGASSVQELGQDGGECKASGTARGKHKSKDARLQ